MMWYVMKVYATIVVMGVSENGDMQIYIYIYYVTVRVTLEHRVLVVFGRNVCQLLTGHRPGVSVSQVTSDFPSFDEPNEIMRFSSIFSNLFLVSRALVP